MAANPSNQRPAAPSPAARKARGKPPRSQRRFCCPFSTSSMENPATWTKRARPARVSDTPRTRSGEALPKSKNFAGLPGRSQSLSSKIKINENNLEYPIIVILGGNFLWMI